MFRSAEAVCPLPPLGTQQWRWACGGRVVVLPPQAVADGGGLPPQAVVDGGGRPSGRSRRWWAPPSPPLPLLQHRHHRSRRPRAHDPQRQQHRQQHAALLLLLAARRRGRLLPDGRLVTYGGQQNVHSSMGYAEYPLRVVQRRNFMTLFFGLDQGFPRGLACARLRRRGRIVGVGIRKQGRWMVGGFFSCRRVLACLLETQCYLLSVIRGY